MARAIRFHETGAVDVLKLETVEVGEPGPGQARVRHTYVAVNFIGLLDEFALFERPLTQAEVTRLFEQPGCLAALKKKKE